MPTTAKPTANTEEKKRIRMMPPIGFDGKIEDPSTNAHYRRFCFPTQDSVANRRYAAAIGSRLRNGTTLAVEPLEKHMKPAGNEEPNEPGVRINRFPKFRRIESRNRSRQKSRQIDRYADQQRPHRLPVDPVRVFILAPALVQIIEIEVRFAYDEIVGNHDAANRTKKRRIPDEPRKNIALR